MKINELSNKSKDRRKSVPRKYQPAKEKREKKIKHVIISKFNGFGKLFSHIRWIYV